MFGKPFPLFRLFGFSVKADPSWLIVVVLVVWTLAAYYFPQQYPGLRPLPYWLMGVCGAIGLFGSIVLHELAHSLVARRFDVPIRGITLFIFGGVAELDREPPTPKAEFWVAIAGPIMSALLGLAALALWSLTAALNGPLPARALLAYLGMINLLLVAFNMIPAFPLDGGRVLRSILWAAKGSLRWATKVTSTIGSAFGLVLIGLGVFAMFSGHLYDGLWTALIGMFLRGAAGASYQQLLVRRALEGEPVSRFMTRDPITAPADVTLRDFVENYVYQHHFKMFPVVDEDDRLVGCLSIDRVKEVPREEWETTTVRHVAQHCSGRNTIHPETDAMQALSRMQRLRVSRLMVTENDRVVGMFSIRDVMKLMELRVELDDHAPGDEEPPDSREIEREVSRAH
ncbi:MAG: site-2 protease family protein [Planctomycetaceae bacterium]